MFIYITLTVDLLFDHLPLIILNFMQMAVQIPFMSNCSFYINFDFNWIVLSLTRGLVLVTFAYTVAYDSWPCPCAGLLP